MIVMSSTNPWTLRTSHNSPATPVPSADWMVILRRTPALEEFHRSPAAPGFPRPVSIVRFSIALLRLTFEPHFSRQQANTALDWPAPKPGQLSRSRMIVPSRLWPRMMMLSFCSLL